MRAKVSITKEYFFDSEFFDMLYERFDGEFDKDELKERVVDVAHEIVKFPSNAQVFEEMVYRYK